MSESPLRRLLQRQKPGSGDFSRHIELYVPGNNLTLLARGGDVYRAMWKAIEDAEETIHLETYILRSDRTGHEFAKRLIRRCGVRDHLRLIRWTSTVFRPGCATPASNSRIPSAGPVAPALALGLGPSQGVDRRRKDRLMAARTSATMRPSRTAATTGMTSRGAGRPRHLDRLFRALWFGDHWLPHRLARSAAGRPLRSGRRQPGIHLPLPHPPRISTLKAAKASRHRQRLFRARLAHKPGCYHAARRLRKILVPGKSDVQSVGMPLSIRNYYARRAAV